MWHTVWHKRASLRAVNCNPQPQSRRWRLQAYLVRLEFLLPIPLLHPAGHLLVVLHALCLAGVGGVDVLHSSAHKRDGASPILCFLDKFVVGTLCPCPGVNQTAAWDYGACFCAVRPRKCRLALPQAVASAWRGVWMLCPTCLSLL